MKRRRRRSNPEILIWCVFVSTMLWSCNVREPGCLDIDAQNFDFDADRHDQDLCVYPNLILNVLYQWADSSLQQGFLYRNAHGMDYAIHGVQILFSDFLMTDGSGEEISIEQMISFTAGECGTGNPQEVPDDFLFVDRSLFSFVVGAFRESGPMERLRVSLGVNDAYTPLCLESFPVSHKLRNPRAAYDQTLGDFAVGRFIISKDSINAKRDTLLIYRAPEILTFDLSRTFTQGRPDTLFMTVDFRNIFDPADLSLTNSMIASDLGSRMSQSVQVR